jgi:hypothetical protein
MIGHPYSTYAISGCFNCLAKKVYNQPEVIMLLVRWLLGVFGRDFGKVFYGSEPMWL